MLPSLSDALSPSLGVVWRRFMPVLHLASEKVLSYSVSPLLCFFFFLNKPANTSQISFCSYLTPPTLICSHLYHTKCRVFESSICFWESIFWETFDTQYYSYFTLNFALLYDSSQLLIFKRGQIDHPFIKQPHWDILQDLWVLCWHLARRKYYSCFPLLLWIDFSAEIQKQKQNFWPFSLFFFLSAGPWLILGKLTVLLMLPSEMNVFNVTVYMTLDLRLTLLLVTMDYKTCSGPLHLQQSCSFPCSWWIELLQLGKSQGGHWVPGLKPGTTSKKKKITMRSEFPFGFLICILIQNPENDW